MLTLIKGGTLVSDGRRFRGDILVQDDTILRIITDSETPQLQPDKVVDAAGCLVIPGVIDSHVHMREPGLEHKATIATETRAALAGGVTTVLDMPNTVPQTTTPEALADKRSRAARDSVVNCDFLVGATNDNAPWVCSLRKGDAPAVKVFMGSSTGNMLVDGEEALRTIFSEVRLPVMTHNEDTALINANMQEAQRLWGDDPDVTHHPFVRSAEACWRSTSLAVGLAREYGTRLHVAHVTTARELELFSPGDRQITAEATVAHLLFSDADYATLGTRIKCNPAVKTMADRDALRRGLMDGRIYTIGTDHAPHLLSEKEGGCRRAVSGMPMVQFSLVAMLSLVDGGVLTVEKMVELMCHNPATLFNIEKRGYLREGYRADIAIVSDREPWKVTADCILSKCGWSPVEGRTFRWRVEGVFVNGKYTR